MTDFVFTSFTRESRPLSHALGHRAAEYLGAHLASYTEEQMRTMPVDDLVAELVAKALIVPPQIGKGVKPDGQSVDTSRPTDRYGVTGTVHVLKYTVETSGDIDWLRYWPDNPGVDVDPVDKDADPQEIHQSVPYDQWDPALALERWELRQLTNRWCLLTKDGTTKLVVRVNVTSEEVTRAAESGPVASRVVHDWVDEIRPVVEAIAAQIRQFNDHDLPAMYHQRITDLQRNLRGLDRMFTEVEIPFESLSQPDLSIEQADDTNGPPEAATGVSQVLEVTLGNHKLARASFEDVVRTIRVWANGVQRYPRSYSQFTEDMLSDTLCVTLNAALPGSADREVYRHAGKTDITVRADAVDEGLGPEVVFVCESKIWDGQGSVEENFDQLRGYLGTRAASAVLLYGVGNKNLDDVQGKAVAALERLDGFQHRAGQISGWPLLHFERDGQQIDLVVAFVHTYDQKAVE